MATRLFSPDEVGSAIAFFAYVAVPGLLARLGLDQTLLRFLASEKKGVLFYSALTIAVASTVLFGIVAIVIGQLLWSVPSAITSHPGAYIIFLILDALFFFTGVAFIGLRSQRLYLAQVVMLGIRILLLVPFAFLGEFGIIGAVGLSLLVAGTWSVTILNRMSVGPSKPNWMVLKRTLTFSVANYFSMIFMVVPGHLLPIIVFGQLGPDDAAYYYMAYMIASLLFVIPSAVGTVMTVEGAHGSSLSEVSVKSFAFMATTLIPAIAVLLLLGDTILGLLGQEYTQGTSLLKLMAVSSFPMAICSVFYSARRVKRKLGALVLVSGVNFALLISMSYVLMQDFALDGIGYAWILTQTTSAGLVTLIALWERKRPIHHDI